MQRGMRRAHHMPFGAELTPAGHVRFRLWAPAAAGVELVLCEERAARPLPMAATGGGFFELRTAQARRREPLPLPHRRRTRGRRSGLALQPARRARAERGGRPGAVPVAGR